MTVTCACIRRTQRAENVLAVLGIIQRRAVDRDDQVAVTQPEATKACAIPARIDPVATQFAVGKYRLRP